MNNECQSKWTQDMVTKERRKERRKKKNYVNVHLQRAKFGSPFAKGFRNGRHSSTINTYEFDGR